MMIFLHQFILNVIKLKLIEIQMSEQTTKTIPNLSLSEIKHLNDDG
jgi:hypothetical protein